MKRRLSKLYNIVYFFLETWRVILLKNVFLSSIIKTFIHFTVARSREQASSGASCWKCLSHLSCRRDFISSVSLCLLHNDK